MTITACGAQTAAVLAWCCFISVLLASGGGGNLVPEPEDTIRCSDFLERDAVPQKYPQALLSAAESCEAQAASTNRYALFDCILGTLQSSPKVPEWARCLSFLSPFLLSSAHQSPNADDTETLLSAAKQLLLRKSDVALNADSLQTKVMETVKHLLRNVTCSGAVPASPAIEQTTWTYKPDRTFSKLNLKPTLESESFTVRIGFLTAGSDLMTGVLSIAEAEALCNARVECNGFTFRHNAPPSTLFDSSLPSEGSSHSTGTAAVSRDEQFEIFFKRVGSDFVLHDQWLTYTKSANSSADRENVATRLRRTDSDASEEDEDIGAGHGITIGSCDDETCGHNDILNENGLNSSGRTYRVDVYRHDPLILVVRDFVTLDECGQMIEQASPKLTPAQVAASGAHSTKSSTYRASMSANLYPDYISRDSLLNDFAFRSYALARDMLKLPSLVPAGQEPVNLVHYNPGHEYRPHCDGECYGRPFKFGTRVATALAYCKVPSKGGATTFTQGGIKVEAVEGSLLFFAYRHEETGEMDNGLTEHSGCPVEDGEKWIAVQWFRDGVNELRPWDSHRG